MTQKNLQYLNLWPTVICKSTFEVEEETIMMATQKEVSNTIHDLARKHFDAYLKDVIGISLYDYKEHRLDSWINRYENTDMEYHTHNGAHLSAVFYPIVEGDGGEITFYDPRFFAARGYDMNFRKLHSNFVIKPSGGDVVIFPSFLYHSVKVSTGFKLSIPVDLFLFNDN
jgi:uncharacterized protein (TIGR02466 family)